MDNVLQFPSPSTATEEIADAGARAQALDIRRSWIVEAPAGSGKTGLLIQRYLKLLSDDTVTEPEQVLAITFTVKATAEMRERVVHHLQAAQHPSPPGETEFDRLTRAFAASVLARSDAFHWDLLAQPQRLNIRTIDSISSEIVSALPLLSGSGGPRGRTETPEALHLEAARRTLLLLGGSDPALDLALRTLLHHRDANLANCERLIAEMLASREQWGRLIPLGEAELADEFLDATVLPRLEHALEQIVCAGLTRLSTRMPQHLLAELTTLAAGLARNDGYQGEPSPIAHCAGLHTLPGQDAGHLAHWRALIHLLVTASSPRKWRAERGINKKNVGFEISPAEKAALSSVIDQVRHDDDLLQALLEADALPPAQYPAEQWIIAKALFRILRRALVELKLLFAEREECDYTEITLGARSALSHDAGASEFAGALGMRLQHLLVDEMQDTSLSQYDLIELLTRGWDGHSQTAFLVGDPKQSIYLFRQARVERFLRTMHDGRLGDLALGSLRLTANFRSQQKLVSQFNLDFARIFPGAPSGAAGTDVPFVQAAPVRSPSPAAGLLWHVHPVASSRLVPGARARQETADADEICRILEHWRALPPPPGRTWKIAVLVRARLHLDPMVRMLKQAAIPFRAVNVEALDDRREVLDLYALTRALLHPADRLAWFAVLRAPWCGLGLADLHRLAGSDDPAWAERTLPSAILQRGELLSADGCDRLARTWPVLEEALAQRGRLTTAQWVERTWRSLGGDAYATPEELANVRYFLQLLDQLEREQPFLDLARLRQTMGTLYAQSVASPGAIDLMTIHGAKGLEWDVVILPALERKTRVSVTPLLSWLELDLPGEDAAHILLAPIHGSGQDSDALNRWIARVRGSRDHAERKRLFYVACTRAREELHLFAAPELSVSGSLTAPPPGSLLEAAWPAAGTIVTAALTDLPLPAPPQEPVLQLAAAAASPTVRRLPLEFDPRERFRQGQTHPLAPASSPGAREPVSRPEGSFAARAFGNTVHACMEQLAQCIADGISPAALLAQLPSWQGRIAALLRNSGLSPADLSQWTTQTLHALRQTLEDPIGQWLLAPHPQASSELALDLLGDAPANLRLDRSFLAGPEPKAGSAAEAPSTLWIVDFKTADPGGRDPASFFAQQKEAYRAQLESYARAQRTLSGADLPIRLGLYYPLVPHLVWWSDEQPTGEEDEQPAGD